MNLFLFSLNLMCLYWTLIWLILVSNYFYWTSNSTSWHDVLDFMAWCYRNHGMMLSESWHDVDDFMAWFRLIHAMNCTSKSSLNSLMFDFISLFFDFAGILWHKKREQFDFTVLFLNYLLLNLHFSFITFSFSLFTLSFSLLVYVW